TACSAPSVSRFHCTRTRCPLGQPTGRRQPTLSYVRSAGRTPTPSPDESLSSNRKGQTEFEHRSKDKIRARRSSAINVKLSAPHVSEKGKQTNVETEASTPERVVQP